jgi:hypothetical protein
MSGILEKMDVTANIHAEKTTPIESFFTAHTSWLNSQAGRRCGLFEKQWLDCASRVGLSRAMQKDCINENRDLKECQEMSLAYKRYHRMQEERQKKGLPFQDPPPYDVLPHQKFKTVVF